MSEPTSADSHTPNQGDIATLRTRPVQSRDEPFVAQLQSRIWAEQASAHNPYIAESALCYGYDLGELMAKRSFVDVFYLLFRGELPAKEQAQLLEKLMIALIHPGPRHTACRAAMNAAVGKTNPAHILPIALGVLGGEVEGAGQLEAAMRFLRKAYRKAPAAVVQSCDWRAEEDPSPGFGQHYGGIDLLTSGLAKALAQEVAAGEVLQWAYEFAEHLAPLNRGWLRTGLAAAVLCDLGFQPRAGACLFQLLCAPGLAAQALELVNKPITAMPFVKDENYVIES